MLHSTEEIVGLVFMREQARQAKEFSQADHTRQRLVSMDVTLFDKNNQWRTGDGRVGRIPTFSDMVAGATPESFLAESGHAPLGAPRGDPREAIKHLVMRREQARASKDFAQSDMIRDELKAMGVELFDKEKLWKSKDGHSGVVIGYRGSGGPTDIEINALIKQREKARQSNDYDMADMIRDELQQRGIGIFDKEKMWRSNDGRSGAVPMYHLSGAGSAPGHAPSPSGAATPSPAQQQILLLAQQQAQDPSLPQTMMAMLQQAQAAAQAVNERVFGTRFPEFPAATSFSQANMAGTTFSDFSSGGGFDSSAFDRGGYNNPGFASTGLNGSSFGGSGGGFDGGGGFFGGSTGGFNGGLTGLSNLQPINGLTGLQSGPTAANAEVTEAVAFCAQAIPRGLSNEEILWLVGMRERQRQARDFASADALRDAMRKCGVELWEKEKRWQAADGRQGSIPSWNALH